MTLFLSIFLRPFVLIVLFLCVLYPARLLVQRRMPDGRLKRLLLRRVA